ncbi:MAG: sulfatase-like hydrolase/transferase, partial [Acidobacteriota bacterium]|nr:sulfatase-like hydrolase/transferase [Acidobacteriota bacterium]
NGPASWRWNGGMKGKKGSVDEGGLRVPFLIRWPGRIKPKTRVAQIAGAIDLLPTLADMAGIPVASRKPLDGKSIKSLLLNPSQDWPDRMLFSLWNNKVSVRTQQYRLDPTGHLFDIVADPQQDSDVSRDKPEVAAKLREAVSQWSKEMLPMVGPDDRPFTVGYSTTTMLPARDGIPAGGVQRSAGPPNCSFFTNWTNVDDRITWDIEVGRAGQYEAAIYYTCHTQDAGSTVELSFLGERAEAKVAPAWDPPLIGAQDDRVPRGESFVKDFKPLPAGIITLKKERGKLILRALSVPGRQVADVRYVALTFRTFSGAG